jgi:hypothetical protein
MMSMSSWLRNTAKALRDPETNKNEIKHIVSSYWTFSQHLDSAAEEIENLLNKNNRESK